jgi:hypothetical protein
MKIIDRLPVNLMENLSSVGVGPRAYPKRRIFRRIRAITGDCPYEIRNPKYFAQAYRQGCNPLTLIADTKLRRVTWK